MMSARKEESLIKETLNINDHNTSENLDRRYYYIRIMNIENVHEQICSTRQPNRPKKAKNTERSNQYDKGDYKAVISMSLKKSDTRFQLNKYGNLVVGERRRLKKQAHMFCFEYQQTMTISLSYAAKNQEKEDKQKKKPIGFAKVLLTPFILAPQTKHTITVKMALRSDDLSIKNEIAAVMTLQLYFLLQFKAQLQITPCSADLFRNIASVGQMRPAVILQMNNQRKKSLIARNGGIHPDWQDNSRIIKQQIEQQEKKAEDFKPEQIQNKFLFDLISAGHELKLSVINYPFLGEDATLIGENTIRIQSCNFFRTPQVQFTHKDKNAVKLFYTDPEKKVIDAGILCLKTKFNYNAKQIRQDIDSDSEESDGWEEQSP